jgi:rhodanese-related sulfurtransferase
LIVTAQRQLNQLPDSSRAILEAATLLDQPFSFSLLIDLGFSVEALDPLFDNGIFGEPFPSRAEFTDSELRNELLGRMPWSKKRRFCEQVGELLEVRVYPAHGAGSFCGRQISSAPFTTIGQEAETNWALQFTDRARFVEAMVANLPERPPYFARSVAINLRGAPFLSDSPAVAHLRLAEFNALKEKGATTLDVRPGALFGEGHAVDSLNIGIAGPSFSVWSGFFLNPDLPVALVVEDETEAKRAQLEMARIGFDQVLGFITADDLDETRQITQIGARDFLASLGSPQRPVVLDVRSAQEWSQDHLEGAIHIPLPQLLRRVGGFSRKLPLTVVCGSGYRSSIAASLLESEGFERLSTVPRRRGRSFVEHPCGGCGRNVQYGSQCQCSDVRKEDDYARKRSISRYRTDSQYRWDRLRTNRSRA